MQLNGESLRGGVAVILQRNGESLATSKLFDLQLNGETFCCGDAVISQLNSDKPHQLIIKYFGDKWGLQTLESVIIF